MAKGIPTKGPRLKRYLADPGLRSRLPDRALPPALLARRRANARNAALDDPNALTAPMTPRTLRDAVNASTRLKFAPQEQQVGTQLVQTDAQSQRIKDFYKNYLDDLQGIQAQQGAAYQQAQSDIAARAQGAYSAASGQAQQVDNAMQADAQLRGTTAAPDTAARQSAAVRLGLGTSLADQLLSQGVHQQDFMGALRASGGGRQIQEQLSNLAQRRALQGQLTTLKGQKGDYAAQLRQQMVSDAQKYGLEQAAFGVTKAKAKAAAQQGEERIKTTRRGQTLSHKDRIAQRKANQQAAAGKINQYGYTAADWAALSTDQRQKIIKDFKKSGGKGGSDKKPRTGLGSLTQGQENKYVSQLNTAISFATAQLKKKNVTHSDVRTALQTGLYDGQHYDPDIITAAFYRANGAPIPRWLAKRLQRMGVHMGGRWPIGASPKPKYTHGQQRP